jgi:hypothetical protein
MVQAELVFLPFNLLHVACLYLKLKIDIWNEKHQKKNGGNVTFQKNDFDSTQDLYSTTTVNETGK